MYEFNYNGSTSYVSNYFCCHIWSQGLETVIRCWERLVSDS